MINGGSACPFSFHLAAGDMPSLEEMWQRKEKACFPEWCQENDTMECFLVALLGQHNCVSIATIFRVFSETRGLYSSQKRLFSNIEKRY